MKVLLSIKPEFVREIFSGKKKFEYRRTIFRSDVDCIVVYASSPVRMVVGELYIGKILHAELSALWTKTNRYAGISECLFYSYFSNKEKGYAITIDNVVKFDAPKTLQEHYPVKAPPQSFAYLYD